ncbi:MAG: iron donor protein CyaY [Burkholderiaceae bacterium]|jgi:CyaY protein
MTDNEFLAHFDGVVERIEATLEDGDLDVEPVRSGNVLSLEFDDGAKIIINSQLALHEIWLAARSGGFHFRLIDGLWRDSRDGSEFYEALSKWVTHEAGKPVTF